MPKEAKLQWGRPRADLFVPTPEKEDARDEHDERDETVGDEGVFHADALEGDAGGVGEDEATEAGAGVGEALVPHQRDCA